MRSFFEIGGVMLSINQGKLINKYIKTYVLFDLETTGTNSNADEVVEISAIKVVDEEIVDEFSTLVNPGISIPYDASEVNGITDDMVADAPDFKTALADFLEFVGDFPLVGHNIHTFDMKFIYRDCQRFFGKTIDNDYVDTLRIARTYLPQLESRKLVDLASYYDISNKGAHRALNDCRMNQQVFYHLQYEMTEDVVKSRGLIPCPKCGGVMTKRSGKFGDFLGCTSYPECRYTRNL